VKRTEAKENAKISQLQAKVERLREELRLKDIEIAKLEAQSAKLETERDGLRSRFETRLALSADLTDRLETQVARFEQLMSKVFRKERREALALEIEKLDNGELP
jgi:predicted  nucleic acid-binding Zn-ribbon protein